MTKFTRRIEGPSIGAVLAVTAALWQSHALVNAAEPNTVGLKVRYKEKLIDLPAVSHTDVVSCMAVLPRTAKQESKVTLVCHIGEYWPLKWSGAIAPPESPDRILFIDPETSTYEAFSYQQPGPKFVSVSPDGRYVAFASARGWPTEALERDRMPEVPDIPIRVNGSRSPYPSDLTPDQINHKLAELFVGTLAYTIWETEPIRLAWEMRYFSTAEQAANRRFERPWARGEKTPLPWWAIHNHPDFRSSRISFSPGSGYFAALHEGMGVHVLSLTDGTQGYCCKPVEVARPLEFWFENEESMLVVWSDGIVRRVHLSDLREEDVGPVPDVMGPGRIFRPMNSKTSYPMFSLDRTHGLLASVDGDRLELRNLITGADGDPMPSQGWPQHVAVAVGQMPMGVPRMEWSRNHRSVGVAFQHHREPSNEYRYRDVGFTHRFERVNLTTGRVAERVVGFRSEDGPDFDDDVPTVTLDSEEYCASFSACLSEDGESIVFAVPYRHAPQSRIGD